MLCCENKWKLISTYTMHIVYIYIHTHNIWIYLLIFKYSTKNEISKHNRWLKLIQQIQFLWALAFSLPNIQFFMLFHSIIYIIHICLCVCMWHTKTWYDVQCKHMNKNKTPSLDQNVSNYPSIRTKITFIIYILKDDSTIPRT